MKISPHPQQTIEWMQARAGIPTASEFDNLVSPTGEVRKGKMPTTYLNQKLAEWWIGGPLASLNVFDMEQGRILEEEAIPWYELTYGIAIKRVGLITDNDEMIGCSPDGLIEVDGLDSGIEIKCPAIHTHIGYLLNNRLPDEYIHQVQGSMLVTGRDEWRFVSYRRKLPALVLTVSRDPQYIGALHEALELFLDRFVRGKKRLCELNDGPPKRFQHSAPKPQPAFVSETPS